MYSAVDYLDKDVKKSLLFSHENFNSTGNTLFRLFIV